MFIVYCRENEACLCQESGFECSLETANEQDHSRVEPAPCRLAKARRTHELRLLLIS